MGRLCVEYEAPHGKVPNHGCGAGDRPGGAATNGSGGFSLCRPGARPNSPNRVHSVWGSRQPQLARAQAAWNSRATRTSRLARRTWLARSACLAGSSGLDRSAVLVWPSMGATAVLRHDLCGCRARHADYRCCCWLRPTSSPSRLVLVLGGSVRGNRVLGLLLSALRLNSRRSAPRPTGMGSPQRQVGQKHDRRASPGASEWQEAKPTQRIRFRRCDKKHLVMHLSLVRFTPIFCRPYTRRADRQLCAKATSCQLLGGRLGTRRNPQLDC